MTGGERNECVGEEEEEEREGKKRRVTTTFLVSSGTSAREKEHALWWNWWRMVGRCYYTTSLLPKRGHTIISRDIIRTAREKVRHDMADIQEVPSRHDLLFLVSCCLYAV